MQSYSFTYATNTRKITSGDYGQHSRSMFKVQRSKFICCNPRGDLALRVKEYYRNEEPEQNRQRYNRLKMWQNVMLSDCGEWHNLEVTWVPTCSSRNWHWVTKIDCFLQLLTWILRKSAQRQYGPTIIHWSFMFFWAYHKVYSEWSLSNSSIQSFNAMTPS